MGALAQLATLLLLLLVGIGSSRTQQQQQQSCAADLPDGLPLPSQAHPQLVRDLRSALSSLRDVRARSVNASLKVDGFNVQCRLGTADPFDAAAACVQLQLPDTIGPSSSVLNKLASKLHKAKLSHLRELDLLRSRAANLLLIADQQFFYTSTDQQLRLRFACNLTFSIRNRTGLDLIRATHCQKQLNAIHLRASLQGTNCLDLLLGATIVTLIGAEHSPRRDRSHQLKRLSKVSFESFWRTWERGQPLLLADMHKLMLPRTKGRLHLKDIEDICGGASVTPQVWAPHSVGWARLTDGNSSRLGAFIQSMNSTRKNPTYVHDFGLPTECPELLKGFVFPSYLTGDLLRIFPPGLLMGSSPAANWPSLFIGPKGTRSGLHIDSQASHFWMLLLQGRKKGKIYRKNETALLYPNFFANGPTLAKHGFESKGEHAQAKKTAPLLDTAVPWEFVMRPGYETSACALLYPCLCEWFTRVRLLDRVDYVLGDLIVVPHHCAHQMLNMEDTVALAGNFVDLVNWDDFLEDQTLLTHTPEDVAGNPQMLEFTKAVLRFVKLAGLQKIARTSLVMPKRSMTLEGVQRLWQNEYSRKAYEAMQTRA